MFVGMVAPWEGVQSAAAAADGSLAVLVVVGGTPSELAGAEIEFAVSAAAAAAGSGCGESESVPMNVGM